MTMIFVILFKYLFTLEGFVFITGKLVWLYSSNSLQNRKTNTTKNCDKIMNHDTPSRGGTTYPLPQVRDWVLVTPFCPCPSGGLCTSQIEKIHYFLKHCRSQLGFNYCTHSVSDVSPSTHGIYTFGRIWWEMISITSSIIILKSSFKDSYLLSKFVSSFKVRILTNLRHW